MSGFRSAAMVLLLLAYHGPVDAQTFRISGRISDSSGAVIAGAKVVAKNNATGSQFSAMSGADGSYSIAAVAGDYTITISAAGFTTEIRNGVVVAPGEAASFDVSLQSDRPAQPPHGAFARPPAPPPPPPRAPAPPRAAVAPRITSGRSFLVGNTVEEAGFGLYSYILLGAEPASDEEKMRDLAVINAFVQGLSDTASLQGAGLPKNELNVTYFLLTADPPASPPMAQWVLDHYNFPRAKAILAATDRSLLTGPYVISALVPMSGIAAAPDHLLVQNMSHVTSDVAASWVQEFEKRAARKNFWAPDTRDQAILDLRTFVSNAAVGTAIVGEGAGDFKSLLAQWISWK